MKISEILAKKRTLSFEVFPPKKEGRDKDDLLKTIDKLKELRPDFISVTYGAGGSTKRGTAEIAGYVKSQGIEPLAHITGATSSPEDIDGVSSQLLSLGVENVLALRGDLPKEGDAQYGKYFPHATDLEVYLKKYPFCLGGACYPEGHPESGTLYADLENLKKKAECGAGFFISQMFYDNSYYYRLVAEAKRAGINVPIIPGIMPVTNIKNIDKIKSMCGSTIPLELRNMLEVFAEKPSAFAEAGINYAVYQITDLIAKGAPGVHVYIMNKSETAMKICSRLEKVLDEYFRT